MAAGVALGPSAGAYGAYGAYGDSRPTSVRPAPGPSDRPSGSPSGSPSAEESGSPLAGRPAGEGRARPGRSLSPTELADSEASADEVPPGTDPGEAASPEADPGRVPAFTPPPDAFPEPGRTARQRQALDEPAVRQVQQVSLGSGIALVGLGLGFLAFRMRRVN